MDHLQFRNIIASLFNLDKHVLVEAGVFTADGQDLEWKAFTEEPARWLLRLDDEKIAALWKLVEARQSRNMQAPVSTPGYYIAGHESVLRLSQAIGIDVFHERPVDGGLQIDAVIDAMTGEVERLKKFNLSRAGILSVLVNIQTTARFMKTHTDYPDLILSARAVETLSAEALKLLQS